MGDGRSGLRVPRTSFFAGGVWGCHTFGVLFDSVSVHVLTVCDFDDTHHKNVVLNLV